MIYASANLKHGCYEFAGAYDKLHSTEEGMAIGYATELST